MQIRSPDFAHMARIPPRLAFGAPDPATHVRLSDNENPALEWRGVPAGTKSYALNLWHVAQGDEMKSYWVVYNIPASATGLPCWPRPPRSWW